jgi:hypothetical protein
VRRQDAAFRGCRELDAEPLVRFRELLGAEARQVARPKAERPDEEQTESPQLAQLNSAARPQRVEEEQPAAELPGVEQSEQPAQLGALEQQQALPVLMEHLPIELESPEPQGEQQPAALLQARQQAVSQ